MYVKVKINKNCRLILDIVRLNAVSISETYCC